MPSLPFGEDVDIADADKLVLVRLKAFDLDHFCRKVLQVRGNTSATIATTVEGAHTPGGAGAQNCSEKE